MSAFEEILKLEEQITRLRNEASEINRKFPRSDSAIEGAQADVKLAEDQLQFNVRNREHSRKAADVVDLNEYAKTLQRIEQGTDSLNSAKVRQAGIQGNRSMALARIKEIDVLIAGHEKALTKYGVLIQLPERAV